MGCAATAAHPTKLYMPELPEVETIRRDLEEKIVGKKIASVFILAKGSVHYPVEKFKKVLVDNKVATVNRRGKLLYFSFKESPLFLLVHLKMTGQLIYVNKKKITAGGHSLGKIDFELPNKFTRVVINFSDGSELFFNDLRRFGYLKLTTGEEKDKILKSSFGIEPLTPDFKYQAFASLFVKRKTTIKALLLNQKLIAGIGNIYADETCFCAGIRPDRRVEKISEVEKKKLFSCISKVLKLSIAHRGTTFNSYVDCDGKTGNFVSLLKVYGRGGEKCYRCKGVIKKVRAAGRGTHFCPKCQK